MTESQNVHADGVCNGMMFLPSDEQLSSQKLYSLSFEMKNHDLSLCIAAKSRRNPNLKAQWNVEKRRARSFAGAARL